jgi:two-component system, OmpR family, sensor kinase
MRLQASRESRESDVKSADELLASLGRLNQLIADLLDVERLEQGIFAISPQPTDLVALAQETAAGLGGHASEIQVQAPESLVVSADPSRIRQALENLIANALQHSPQGAPVVVSVQREMGPGGEMAAISVTDQGPGIPQDVLPGLFQRFGAGPTSKGLGLGLYLACRIAAAHRGTLTVDSAPGTGASFRLALPL